MGIWKAWNVNNIYMFVNQILLMTINEWKEFIWRHLATTLFPFYGDWKTLGKTPRFWETPWWEALGYLVGERPTPHWILWLEAIKPGIIFIFSLFFTHLSLSLSLTLSFYLKFFIKKSEQNLLSCVNLVLKQKEDKGIDSPPSSNLSF